MTPIVTHLLGSEGFFGAMGNPLLSFLAVPQEQIPSFSRSTSKLTLEKHLSKKTWWYFLFRLCVRSLTIHAPRPVSAVALTLPVYIWKLEKYPLLLSPSTHTFIPHLMGFIGIYCLREKRPVNLIIASSMATSLCGEYTDLNFCEK